MKIVYIREHTERGTTYRPGTVREVSEYEASRLIGKGVATIRREVRTPEETKEPGGVEEGGKQPRYERKEGS